MPVYQYRCNACGGDLEARQSFTDAALTDCSECGKAGTLRKVFNSVGVVFKGSGFYRTDSRSQSTVAAQRSPQESSSSTKTESTSETSTTKSESSSSATSTDSAAKSKPKAASAAKS
ncbi:FmdB family zinc ribbon protein [Natronoglycomyces albus]|uniref:FmdB family transcriptional regulator n=1 Tax=Natronoglycomyces albus TaxID=2811108 RepID=A0A895XQZ3_9ACTN|nr:FmdB family zinc ribbon protein [Natronoglycomyces albus]QSB04690.1 FmdB family transcriptional regulator [Natronoglycomyces albus]